MPVFMCARMKQLNTGGITVKWFVLKYDGSKQFWSKPDKNDTMYKVVQIWPGLIFFSKP
jgi:hypothetical protein